ncbi:conserved exported hypothetical protein [Candidatus Sulfopaludibacter sp. SbA6]|nr:conserved exported hypothetical protein [Candidatus Sulfopaludibacter sp. SbA6]
MKTIKVQQVIRRALCLVWVPLLAGGLMVAQQPAPPAQAPAQLLSPEQLDTLVAPVALYPDPLLSQVLVASTYPLEVVEAQQWLQRNGNLKGQQLTEAARQQNWDASVQAMVAFPDVLTMLNQDVQWTTALGNAFLAQQSDVMAAVQRMRARAQANGRLSTTPQQTVTTETQGGQTAIDIAPADPQVIYVPQYDPAYVWGPPAWGYYPPLYYAGYGFGFYPGINIGLYFGGWGGWGYGGWGWGWGPNWFGRSLFVNGGFFNRYGFRGGLYAGGFGGRAAWQHDASHRLGVSYPNSQLASRYGAASMGSRNAMTRSGSVNSARSAGTGSWNRFGTASSSFANRSAATQGARSAAPQSAGRATGGQWQHFQGAQRNQAPAQRYSAPAQRYSAPAQRYSAPAQRYSAPAQRYSAPAQRYSAPSSAGRSYGGGGASRSYSSGGGTRSSGGHSAGGGASHGGGRR